MKTTIELPDDLLERCKAVARRENSTLKALVEEGLRLALRSRARRRAAPFTVQPFEGDGLTPEFTAAGWERVCDEIYGDRCSRRQAAPPPQRRRNGLRRTWP